MIGWMMGEERSSTTVGEKMRAQTGKTDRETEKWGKGKQVKTKQRKRKRETDAENGSQELQQTDRQTKAWRDGSADGK